MTTRCSMGVAVPEAPAAFTADLEAAKAGAAVGPRAVVNASSKAIVLREASEIFNLLSILSSARGSNIRSSAGREVADLFFTGMQKNIATRCFGAVAQVLNEHESGASGGGTP